MIKCSPEQAEQLVACRTHLEQVMGCTRTAAAALIDGLKSHDEVALLLQAESAEDIDALLREAEADTEEPESENEPEED
jgi:hypothetical protein